MAPKSTYFLVWFFCFQLFMKLKEIHFGKKSKEEHVHFV